MARIENPIVQGHYIKKLAKTLDTSEETVVESMRRLSKGEGFGGPKEEKQEDVRTTRSQKLETYILALVLQGKRQSYLKNCPSGLLLMKSSILRCKKFWSI